MQKAHESGVIHRDLKPDNIMVDLDGDPIVLDFGLARRVDDNVQVTVAGVVVGTPAFMSPEQVDGNPAKIGPASDIYSLGIVLYQLLTNQLPFKGSLTSILNQIGSKQPVKPSTLNVSIGEDSPLEQICMKMVAKSPSDRFSSMSEVATALESLTGKVVEIPVTHTSTMSRLKSWSTGIFSNLVRGAPARKPSAETPSESDPDADARTLVDPP
jgi:serine/threonine-protein kinase